MKPKSQLAPTARSAEIRDSTGRLILLAPGRLELGRGEDRLVDLRELVGRLPLAGEERGDRGHQSGVRVIGDEPTAELGRDVATGARMRRQEVEEVRALDLAAIGREVLKPEGEQRLGEPVVVAIGVEVAAGRAVDAPAGQDPRRLVDVVVDVAVGSGDCRHPGAPAGHGSPAGTLAGWSTPR